MSLLDALGDGFSAIAETSVIGALRDLNDTLNRKMWNAAKRQAFYQRLATYVENGKGLSKAITELREQATTMAGPQWKHRFNVNLRALSELAMRVAGGATLADALQGWAPDSERGLIRSGEGSGRLPDALRSAVAAQALVKRIVVKIAAVSFDPLLMLASVIFLIDLVGSQMVPPMLSFAPPDQWPSAARLLLPMAAVANSPLSKWGVVVFFVLFAMALATMPVFTGPIRARLDHIPPWSIYKAIQAAGWVNALADLLASGMPLSKALLLQEQWATPWLRERVAAARIRVQGGVELGTAFADAGHSFPEKTLIMDFKAFSGFRDFPTTIKRVAGEWFVDYEAKIIGTIVVMGAMTNILVNVVMLITVVGMMSLQNVMMAAAH